jgi:ADP-ribose pyrophosphatase YjhB (NUDIX family)
MELHDGAKRVAEMAVDSREYHWSDDGQDWLASWRPPGTVPDGKRHGSAAVCFTSEGQVLLVSEGGTRWGLPGGRPEGEEDWRETLDREVLEEGCATVDDAVLLGFGRGQCVRGHEQGLILVRSLWYAAVTLNEWRPLHEVTHRRLVDVEQARSISLAHGHPPTMERLFHEALAVRDWRLGVRR